MHTQPPQYDRSASRRTTQARWHAHLAAGDGAVLEVNLKSILRNAQTISVQANGKQLLAVVKSDAYGLGAAMVAQALSQLNPWGFAVATVQEGIDLRQAGITAPVLVLMPASTRTQKAYHEHGLRAVLDDHNVIRQWTTPYHLEIDTGMSRCGVRWDDGRLNDIAPTDQFEGAFTHFHSADDNPDTVIQQCLRFESAVCRLRRRPRLLHVSNSAGVWSNSRMFDLIRPGIFLYGGHAGPIATSPEPVVSLLSRIVSVRELRAGEAVSYGRDWRTPVDTTVATLAIGYADGILRSIQGNGHVLLHGQRCPIVGRITMNMLMVDCHALRDHGVQVGDVATLIGCDGNAAITIDDFAEWNGTISYEILTRMSPHLTRVYLDDVIDNPDWRVLNPTEPNSLTNACTFLRRP